MRGFTPHLLRQQRGDTDLTPRKGAGFTLIELLIVIGILVIVSGLSVPFLQTFQVSSDLYTHANTVTQILRRAQRQAVVGLNSSDWGVYFNNGNKKFILFKGEDYVTRDMAYDQETDYPKVFNIATDFGDEIYFSLYSGRPSVVGNITVVSSDNNNQMVNIADSGLIQIIE